jgi:hypothetical protein
MALRGAFLLQLFFRADKEKLNGGAGGQAPSDVDVQENKILTVALEFIL